MQVRFIALSLPLTFFVLGCPEPPCESVFDCAVGETCSDDGTCVAVEPEPSPVPNPEPSPAVDAGLPDAGVVDAGSDAGVSDSGVVDGGIVDGGVSDAGPIDGGLDAGALVDAGLFDAGLLDAGLFDAGALDAGALDGGLVDAGGADAGVVLPPIVFLAGSGSHKCAILNDGGAKCWGSNTYGQLGLGDTNARGDTETEFSTLNLGGRAVSIAPGQTHTCGILEGGELVCWGANFYGQLGFGDTEHRGDDEVEFSTVFVGIGRTAEIVVTGHSHTCAILDDGSVKCWGANSVGQLGVGDTNSREAAGVPVNLGAGRTAVSIAAGQSHTCAVLDDGGVKCWGANFFGQLGLGDVDHRGDTETDFFSVNLGPGRTAVSISTGYSHTCVLLDDTSVKCWGRNDSGQLGLGDVDPRGDTETEFASVNLGAGRTAISISAGSSHTCVLLDDTSVKCWGSNQGGQLGLGDTEPRGDTETDFSIVDLGAGLTASAVVAGGGQSCVLFEDGQVKCWGFNLGGQLGLGDIDNRGDETGEMGNALPFVQLQ